MPGGATAVALAAQQGNTAALLEMLRFRGENAVSDALLNNATEDGSTPLTLAMYGAFCMSGVHLSCTFPSAHAHSKCVAT